MNIKKFIETNKKIIYPLVGLLILLTITVYFYFKAQYRIYTKLSCGGFVGTGCPKGYRCQYEGNSTGGWCVGNGWSPKLSEVTETYLKSPDAVETFNGSFKNKKRNLSFSYPQELAVIDNENGSIKLEKNGVDYILLEEIYPLTNVTQGNNEEEKFRKYYLSFNNKYGNESLPEYKRISLTNGNFTYKVFLTESGYCGNLYVEQDNPWSCYLAVINKKGISLANVKNISEKTIVTLLDSIKFSSTLM